MLNTLGGAASAFIDAHQRAKQQQQQYNEALRQRTTQEQCSLLCLLFGQQIATIRFRLGLLPKITDAKFELLNAD